MAKKTSNEFTFQISLSVLNHLGRSLYRSFATVLGEAISNSWDADAKNVNIYIDRGANSFVIQDDGVGMDALEFQQKFLKIGYSKRKAGSESPGGRPYIGRKGIGKLALLSCADRIAIISKKKKKGSEYIGGVIDNSELDDAIDEDLTPQQYPLDPWDGRSFEKYTKGHKHGTIIRFEGVKEGVRGSFGFLAKIIALYFRFSLLDASFNIFLDGDKITYKNLDALAEKTEFLWTIGDYEDPYVDGLEKRFSDEPEDHESRALNLGPDIKGFIASVEKPKDLKVMTTEERVGIDLFVNGRLRERDILKHIPTARVVESYLYGQIHYDSLDDGGKDRFTSSREGIVPDDPKYERFLKKFRKKVLKVVEHWDEWRIKHRQTGDEDNPRLNKRQRGALGLYNAVAEDYEPPKGSANRSKVAGWVTELQGDALFNFDSYGDCFVSENLVRKYIKDQKIKLSAQAKASADKWKNSEKLSRGKGNISIAIRRTPNDASYLDMNDLANLVDKNIDGREASLSRDANEYKPIRDAVAHTALLTKEAKSKLATVRENIKSRIKTILSNAK